jgi:hypothetical protein
MIPMTFPDNLTNAQLAILSAASHREDRCLIAPPNLKGGAAQKVAAKLLAARLVREIQTKIGMAPWRSDMESNQAYSLKLTAAGLKAIAIDDPGSRSKTSADVAPNADDGSPEAKTEANMPATPNPTAAAMAAAPRQGTKIARVIELLQRDEGAKLEELISATGSFHYVLAAPRLSN